MSPAQPGIHRRRCGRGFSYAGTNGESIRDPETLRRIRTLAIPPAWTDVWICESERGHLQAVGSDAAGRRQYRYHEEWQRRRQRQKFDRMLDFARALPRIRDTVDADLANREVDRRRALAAGMRLLDLGFFRIGSEAYAEANGSVGLATILRRHVTVLARTPAPETKTGKRRAVREAISEVSEYLGNTPAVCRSSYIEAAVVDLIEDRASPAVAEAA